MQFITILWAKWLFRSHIKKSRIKIKNIHQLNQGYLKQSRWTWQVSMVVLIWKLTFTHFGLGLLMLFDLVLTINCHFLPQVFTLLYACPLPLKVGTPLFSGMSVILCKIFNSIFSLIISKKCFYIRHGNSVANVFNVLLSALLRTLHLLSC